MSGIIETKEQLSLMRAAEATFVLGSAVYSEIEQTYGKYLFVPFDVPKIVPHDLDKFVDFYYANAKAAIKIKDDIATQNDNMKPSTSPYLTLTSFEATPKSIWTTNYVQEIFTEFPELFEQIHDYFPFLPKDFPWQMWSSTRDVVLHRDMKSMLDMPLRLRIKIFDNNPEETLNLRLSPVDKPMQDLIKLPLPNTTNSFAWNNLRTRHISFFNNPYKKILLISFANYKGQALNQYVDLLERSIAKYKDNLLVDDSTTVEDYLLPEYMPNFR